MGYDFEIKYNPGLLNKAADALSRIPHEVELSVITVPSMVDLDIIQKEVDQDVELQKVIEELLLDPRMHPKYMVEKGRLYYENRVVLSSKSTLIPAILHTYHNSVVGGHSRFSRTYKRLTGELFWRNMKKDVKEYVECC